MSSALRSMWLIAKRDWLEAASTKLFWAGILLGPILVMVVFAIVLLATSFAILESTEFGPTAPKDRFIRYAVIDHTDFLGQEIANEILLSDIRRTVRYVQGEEDKDFPIEILNELGNLAQSRDADELAAELHEFLITHECPQQFTLDTELPFAQRFCSWWDATKFDLSQNDPGFSRYIEVELSEEFDDKDELLNTYELDAYFIIPEDFINSGESGSFVTTSSTGRVEAIKHWYSHYATEVVRKHKFKSAGIDDETMEWLISASQFATRSAAELSAPLAAGETTTEMDESDSVNELVEQLSEFVPLGYQYILWMMVLVGSAMLLAATVEEKATKLAEIILSNADATRLMDGKLVGVALVLLTIAGAWLAMGGVLVFVGGSAVSMLPIPVSGEFLGLFFNPLFLIHFLLYFVLGFTFYGYIQSAIGSVCGNIREAQTLAAPVQILLFMPIIFIVFLALNPDAMFVKVFSFFPPFTPFLMIAMSASLPPLPIYFLNLVVMVAATVGVRALAGRIYRKGILMENKPQKLGDLVKLAGG